MRVLVTGASGLLGSTLVRSLRDSGFVVLRAVRSPSDDADAVLWDPHEGLVDSTKAEDLDGVVHLAGDNIADGRWNDAKKRRLWDRRVLPTRILAEQLAGMLTPPRVLISASAVGIYGNRGDELLAEDSPVGDDFLAKLCCAWEDATQPALDARIRVANMRFGVILSRRGGALKKMLLPFKMGFGGRIGPGTQYMPWISLEDAVEVIKQTLHLEAMEGPFNVCSPNPVTNIEFTKALGSALGRPTFLPLPSFAARMAFGEVADALLLASQRVTAGRLNLIYNYEHETLSEAFADIFDPDYPF